MSEITLKRFFELLYIDDYRDPATLKSLMHRSGVRYNRTVYGNDIEKWIDQLRDKLEKFYTPLGILQQLGIEPDLAKWLRANESKTEEARLTYIIKKHMVDNQKRIPGYVLQSEKEPDRHPRMSVSFDPLNDIDKYWEAYISYPNGRGDVYWRGEPRGLMSEKNQEVIAFMDEAKIDLELGRIVQNGDTYVI